LTSAGPPLSYGQTPGSGPPIVLLHGLGARWQVFQPLMLRLADGWQLTAPDFRGHGRSGRTPGSYRLAEFRADAVRVITAATEPPLVVYGHSLGGWVGLTVAAEHPELVRALVVADSAIYPEHLDPDLAVSYLADLPIALRSLAKSLNQLDPDVMAHFRDGRLTGDYRPDDLLPRVACPTLLLQGDPARDALMSDADVERALALLPDGRHVRFDGLGHGLHVEDTDAVVAAVRPFLDATGGRAPQAAPPPLP
jgi:pimeloyl-ACP methyl ester carboxylesterase